MSSNRTLKRRLPLDLEVIHLEDYIAMSITLDYDSATSLALELILLREGLAGFLAVPGKSKSDGLIVLMNPSLMHSERREVLDRPGWVGLEITPDELGYWVYFLLRYYRDLMPEVDHVDFDIPPQGGAAGVFLTIMIGDVPAPEPSEEAKRILGLSS